MQQRLDKCFCSVCAEAIQKEETEHCVYRSDIWNTCCSSHRNLAICGRGQMNWRKHSKYKWLFCCRLMIWVKPRCGFLWDCFSQFSPRISSSRKKKNRLLFSIFIWDKARENVDSRLMLERPDSAFFSCLRQIIFCKFTVTSVLFSVYYIQQTNFEMQRDSSWSSYFYCVCVCVFLLASMNVCMCKMMVTWMRQDSERENTDQIHIEEILSVSHVDPDTKIWMCFQTNEVSCCKTCNRLLLTGLGFFLHITLFIKSVNKLEIRHLDRPNVTIGCSNEMSYYNFHEDKKKLRIIRTNLFTLM